MAKRVPSILRRPRPTPPEARSVGGQEFLWNAAPALSGVAVTPDSALTLTAYYAALNVLATDTACLPLRVYRRRADGGRDEVRDDPRDELLTASPDGKTTAIRWRQAWMGHALGHGNGYAEVQRRGRGVPYALHLLCPATTRPVLAADGSLGYQLDGGRTIPAASVVHLAGFGFDGLCGYSAARMARQAIGLGLATEAFGSTFFGNGTTPRGALRTPNKLSDQAIKHLRETWDGEHGGPYNAHRPAILEEGLEWQPFSVPPEDAQFLETRHFQVLEIARWFRLPPHKLGDYSHSHLANIESANLDYLMTTLMPWCEQQEQELNRKLFTPQERKAGLYVEHNMTAFLRGDMKARAEFYTRLRDLGVLSPNDIAARENLNPIGPDGDIRLVPLNMISLAHAGQAPEPVPPPPEPSDAQP